MKATIIFIFFLLLQMNFVVGQTYDSLASHHYGMGETINKIDSLGQKQGVWLYYSMFFN